jgi:transposase
VTSLEARLDRLEERLAERDAQIVALKARVAELEAELGRSSSNSGKPPSSDSPAQRGSRPERPKTGKKPGGQPGHSGNQRAVLPQAKVTKNRDVFPKACEKCHANLGRVPVGDPRRHQVIDIPKIIPSVEQWSMHAVRCKDPNCRHVTRAQLPLGVQRSMFGPDLMALMVLLVGAYRMSRRNVQEFLHDVLDIDISLGAISKNEDRVTTALKPAHHEAAKAVRDAGAKNLDATSWRNKGEQRTIWVFACTLATVFFVACDASRATLGKLVGKAKGVLMSDRGGQFDLWVIHMRQLCWAHLLRKFVEYAESRNTEARKIGETLLLYSRAVLSTWHEVRDGTMSLSRFQKEVVPRADQILCGLLERGAALDCPKVAGSCAHILAHRQALFTFAFHADVQPTNNHAEQQVRAFVLWRKTSLGSQSLRGDRFAERIMTVVETCRKQGRHTLSFLREIITADLRGEPTPKLIPATP